MKLGVGDTTGEGKDMNMVAAAAAVALSTTRAGTQPSQKARPEYFTGSVRIDPLFQPKDTTQTSGSYVTFVVGASWSTRAKLQVVSQEGGWRASNC
jgi:hypothetical protein